MEKLPILRYKPQEMSVSQGIKLEMIGRKDSTPEANDYYFTRPNLPALIDLSKCVIFIHPWENDDGSFGAELVIKPYRRPPNKRAKR